MSCCHPNQRCGRSIRSDEAFKKTKTKTKTKKEEEGERKAKRKGGVVSGFTIARVWPNPCPPPLPPTWQRDPPSARSTASPPAPRSAYRATVSPGDQQVTPRSPFGQTDYLCFPVSCVGRRRRWWRRRRRRPHLSEGGSMAAPSSTSR